MRNLEVWFITDQTVQKLLLFKGHLINWRWGSGCFISFSLCSSLQLAFDRNICDSRFTEEFSCLINENEDYTVWKPHGDYVYASDCEKWDGVCHAAKLSRWVQHNCAPKVKENTSRKWMFSLNRCKFNRGIWIYTCVVNHLRLPKITRSTI